MCVYFRERDPTARWKRRVVQQVAFWGHSSPWQKLRGTEQNWWDIIMYSRTESNMIDTIYYGSWKAHKHFPYFRMHVCFTENWSYRPYSPSYGFEIRLRSQMIHLDIKVANLYIVFLIRILRNDHTSPVFVVAGLLCFHWLLALAVVVQVLRHLADLDDQHKPRY